MNKQTLKGEGNWEAFPWQSPQWAGDRSVSLSASFSVISGFMAMLQRFEIARNLTLG